jgi:hypothetical protein
MKTNILLLVFLTTSFVLFSQNKNYILIIDGDSIAIDINQELKHSIKGKKIDLKLVQPKDLIYSDDLISFQYPNDLNVAKTPVDEDIEQLMVMKATGTGYMVQTYKSFNPTLLIDIMLNEITKESVSYGYSKEVKNFERKLSSGQTLKGKTARLEYKGEEEVYTVAAYGSKDEGILVMTMLFTDDNDRKADEGLLKQFFSSLKINTPD